MAPVNRKTFLAVFFMLLFIGALGVRIWVSSVSSGITGPEHIAADSNHIYVHARDTLYVLSSRGRLLRQVPRSQTGLSDTPIDIRLLADGRLLLAEQQPAVIRLCHPETWVCTRIATGLLPELQGQYKVLVDATQKHLLVMDTLTGKLWQWPLEPGKRGSVLIRKGILKRPNDILLDAGKYLWLADSGHRRLAAYSLAGAIQGDPDIKLKANNRFMRDQHDWPMMLAMSAAGELWVVQPDSMGKGGDLLVYEPDKGATARIELPGDAYPTDIVRLGETMLVTDMDQFRIYAINTQTHAVNSFGDAAFERIMQRDRQARQHYLLLENLSLIAMAGFAVLMLLAAIWATPKEKRWSGLRTGNAAAPLAAAAGNAPDNVGIHWLERDPKTERLLRWILPMSILWVMLVLAILVSMYYMFPQAGFRNMIIFSLVAFSGMPILIKLSLRRMHYHLGVDKNYIHLRTPEGRELATPPEGVVYYGRRLAWRDHLVDIQTGNQKPLYKVGEVDTWLGPLLSRARKLDAVGMLLYQVRQRDPVLLFSVVYFFVVALVGIPTGVWKAMLSA